MDIGSYICPECGLQIEGERVVDPSLARRIELHKKVHVQVTDPKVWAAIRDMRERVQAWVRQQNVDHFGLQVVTVWDGTYVVLDAETEQPIAHATSVEALLAAVRLLRRVA